MANKNSTGKHQRILWAHFCPRQVFTPVSQPALGTASCVKAPSEDDRRKFEKLLVESCPHELTKIFASWLIGSAEDDADIKLIVDQAASREVAEDDFETAAVLGFAGDSGILSSTQLKRLEIGIHRLVWPQPVASGALVSFGSDAVVVLGLSLGMRASNTRTSVVVHSILEFLKQSYERTEAEEWHRCLFAASDRVLGRPLELAMPTSPEVADVRTVLRVCGVLERGDPKKARMDAVLTMLTKPEADRDWERVALCLAATEWVSRANEALLGGSLNEILTVRGAHRQVVLGIAVQPHSSPGGTPFLAWPGIQKMIAEHPEAAPPARLVGHIQKAQAEAEAAFRERELTGRWAEWSGVRPWDLPSNVETTKCPWWLAGAEYIFHIVAAWRKYYSSDANKTESVLPTQIHLISESVYWNQLWQYDARFGNTSSADHILGGELELFSDFAFQYVLRKLAEHDLEEWRQQVSASSKALEELEPTHPHVEASVDSDSRERWRAGSMRKRSKLVRRNPRYERIDEALREIAESRPSTQLKIFQQLQDRRVRFSQVEPFARHGGWIRAFHEVPNLARTWLSKRWAMLGLPPLPRGPKK